MFTYGWWPVCETRGARGCSASGIAFKGVFINIISLGPWSQSPGPRSAPPPPLLCGGGGGGHDSLTYGPSFPSRCVGPAAGAASGSAYKGMPFRVCVAPQLHGLAAARPRRFRCVGPAAGAASGTAYKGMSFRVCVAPQLHGPAGARPRRFRCVGPAAVRLP